jgi:hypothetical protein
LVGDDVPELPEPKPKEEPPPGEEFWPGDELLGFEPKPEVDEPDPKAEFVPPPSRAALAFICSIRGS